MKTKSIKILLYILGKRHVCLYLYFERQSQEVSGVAVRWACYFDSAGVLSTVYSLE